MSAKTCFKIFSIKIKVNQDNVERLTFVKPAGKFDLITVQLKTTHKSKLQGLSLNNKVIEMLYKPKEEFVILLSIYHVILQDQRNCTWTYLSGNTCLNAKMSKNGQITSFKAHKGINSISAKIHPPFSVFLAREKMVWFNCELDRKMSTTVVKAYNIR